METQNIDDIYDSNDDDATVLDRGPAIATIEWNSMTFPLYEGDNIVGRSDQKNLDVRLIMKAILHCKAVKSRRLSLYLRFSVHF